MAEYDLITPEEIVRLCQIENTATSEHSQLAVQIQNAWYKQRSTEPDWMRHGEYFEYWWVMGVVFYAGIVYGRREKRARKRWKKEKRLSGGRSPESQTETVERDN